MGDKNTRTSLSKAEEQRIEDALAALAKDSHAPRQITVTLDLHVHREYPKHITTAAGTIVVHSRQEEEAAAREES